MCPQLLCSVLSAASPSPPLASPAQAPLWAELRSCQVPLLLVAGQLDSKFAGIKRRMMARLRQGLNPTAGGAPSAAGGSAVGDAGIAMGSKQPQVQMVTHQWAEVPGVGHAVHVEAPLQLLQLINGFVDVLQEQQQR